MNDTQKQIPEKCPKCDSTDISKHLGYAECYECGYEFSYEFTYKQDTHAKASVK